MQTPILPTSTDFHSRLRNIVLSPVFFLQKIHYSLGMYRFITNDRYMDCRPGDAMVSIYGTLATVAVSFLFLPLAGWLGWHGRFSFYWSGAILALLLLSPPLITYLTSEWWLYRMRKK